MTTKEQLLIELGEISSKLGESIVVALNTNKLQSFNCFIASNNLYITVNVDNLIKINISLKRGYIYRNILNASYYKETSIAEITEQIRLFIMNQ